MTVKECEISTGVVEAKCKVSEGLLEGMGTGYQTCKERRLGSSAEITLYV